MKNLLYIISNAPYANAQGQEALDALLVGAAFEQNVSVLFLHDGVFQLKRGQDVGNNGLKQYTKTFKALTDFGVENRYVYQPSLLARGLVADDLMLESQLIDSVAVSELLSQQFRVFNF